MTTLCHNIQHCDKDTEKICSACKSAKYCSRACQAQHWLIHKPYCEENQRLRKKNGDVPINRDILITDKFYEEASKDIKQGQTPTMRGKDDVVTSIVLRRDNKLYESPSGLKVVNLSSIKNVNAATSKSNWGKLFLECGAPISSDYGHAAFFNPTKKLVIVIEKKTDTIKAECSMDMVIDVSFSQLPSGKVVWEISGMKAQ